MRDRATRHYAQRAKHTPWRRNTAQDSPYWPHGGYVTAFLDQDVANEADFVILDERPGNRERNRKFADSSLEGNGFENSVPRCLATAISLGAFIRRWEPCDAICAANGPE